MPEILETQSQIVHALERGKVGIIPTDTVYGLAARALDPDATSRLYQLKHRENKPGTVIAADIEQLIAMDIPRRYLTPIASYWPNPLSVVIPVVDQELAYLHLGKQSLAVRIPDNERLQAILRQTGPLITSSANPPGEPTAETLGAAIDYFGDTIDFYVDGGDLSGRAPSTIIRIVDDAVEILRQGAVAIKQ